MAKGEIACIEQFVLLSLCFLKAFTAEANVLKKLSAAEASERDRVNLYIALFLCS